VIACGAGDPSGPLPFETFAHELQSGLSEPRREVVRDEAGWARLWEEVHAGVEPRPTLLAVDFSRQMLIVAATGTRPTGGFDVAIRAVSVRGGALEVEVRESCPAPGAMVSMGLTRPVVVALLDRVALPPTFRETKAPSCR
jgi:hypothetical protein